MNNRFPRWTPVAILVIAGSTQSLAGSLFQASMELSALNGSNGFVINGAIADDQSGVSVSCAGDVNGDGVDDLIIGAQWADPNGQTSAGESYVVFGAAGVGAGGALELDSLNGANGFVINGVDVIDRSGISVSNAGDVNGDGYSDVIIGAFYADPNGSESGEAYVVFGGANVGAGGSVDLSSLNGANGFVLNGAEIGDRTGQAVAFAGDINGDGVDDIIIGAPLANAYANRTNSGLSYVVFGDAGLGAGGSLDLASLNGSNGFVINGANANDQSGSAVAFAGDVNNDGVDDLIIGAEQSSANGFWSGQSYVLFGAPGVGGSGSIELASLNGANGFIIDGANAEDRSGASVSSAGDINGDGVDDLLISAPRADPNGSLSGQSYVIFGSTGIGAGGAFDLTALNGANGFALNGIDPADESGISVSSAGDINGDGVDDLIIGAYFADPNGNTYAGESYVVFGGSGVGAGGSIELSSLDGVNGFVLNGIDPVDFCGKSVSHAGDINNDGVDDIIIGAIWADANGLGSGESYVVFGRTPCQGDLNADGVIDTADLGALLAQFNTTGASADINNDGIVDTADLGILLDAFGQAICP